MEDASDPWAHVAASKQRFWHAVRWGPAVAIAAVFLLRVPLAALGVIVAWVVWVGMRSAAVEEHRCPRCGNELFRNGLYHNQFAARCLNCGQAIGAPVRRLLPRPKSHER
jgi:hypothetical protein